MIARCLLALALVLAPAARGQEGGASAEPATLDEGRPTTVRVTWVHGRDTPALVRRLVVRGAGSERVVEAAREERFVWLADEALALTLEAHDDPGVEARAPRGPVTARVEGEPGTVLRQVVAGESLIATIDVVPRGEAVELALVADLVALRSDVLPAGARLLVPGATHTWRPGAPADDDPPEGGPLPDPRALLPPPPPPDPDPLGLAPAAPHEVVVRLARWVPPGLGPSSHALLRKDVAAALTATRDERRVRIPVRAAPFGLRAAAEKSGLDVVERAVRLPDDRWVLQASGRFAVVAPDAAAAVFDGDAFPLALDLARDGQAALPWLMSHERPDLAAALEAAGQVRAQGKGLVVEVTPATLVPVLEALRAHGGRVVRGQIEVR
ncbi:MAG: hypothetical protein M9894_35750 [Planctomycetes bacterium]|nr:hypothetical protein [Planctomycetota bacterium]